MADIKINLNHGNNGQVIEAESVQDAIDQLQAFLPQEETPAPKKRSCPQTRNPCTITVWMRDNDDPPRFVAAYPA